MSKQSRLGLITLTCAIFWIALLYSITFAHSQISPKNPFEPYKYLLPGNSYDQTQMRLVCNDFSEYHPYPPYMQYFYCLVNDGTFKSISLTLDVHYKITYTSFYVIPNKIRIGDLISWYPDMKSEYNRYSFYFSNGHISVLYSKKTFSYYRYIQYIVFRK